MAYRSNSPYSVAGAPGLFGLRREIDQLFEDAFGGTSGQRRAAAQGATFTPAVDAREEEREIVLHMDLPGVRPEDVDIQVENGLLTVRGERAQQQRKEGDEGRYHFVERSYGSFSRAFHLPQGVDDAQITADFEHGELTIRVPKPAQPQPRRVQVGAGGGRPQVGGADRADGGRPAA